MDPEKVDLGVWCEAIACASAETAKELAEKIDALIENHLKQLTLCDELKRSLMARLKNLRSVRSELMLKHRV